MKKLLIVSMFFFALILLAACGSDEGTDNASNGEEGSEDLLTQLKEEGTVTVGFANEAPYAYQEDGELKGAAVDIAQAVFKEMGIEKVESKLADFGQLIPGLNAGKFDVITAGMAIKPDRCENADFGAPEMQYGEGLIVQKGNPLDIHSYADIAANPDITVSVMAGATEVEFLKQMGVSEDQIQTASDIPGTFSAVASGRADATTGTEMTVKMALKSAGNDKLEFVEDFEQPDIDGIPSYGAAAFHLDNDKLREAYNEQLAKLKEDGTVKKLLEANGFSAEGNSVPADITTEAICSGEIK
ncbi:ectoine/hydroxyectoine ABC transporter substrate-binding protein EhuB [Virgibacillus sp. DJP39]|uniref:ectoine/hydroxyectoine ABC transporter substrate-binding protein EhuB n=1 Tax=Virgibacillus sp. DJP39 TaxID=3409790 RepID=UPI003BB77BF7